jgi:hypothetical protein
MITNTANYNQVSTYNSQVTGNHPTSTGLSMAKQFIRSWPNKVKGNPVDKDSNATTVSLNSYNLMQQYI